MITINGEYFDPNADSIEVLVGGKKLYKLCSYVYSLYRYTVVNTGIHRNLFIIGGRLLEIVRLVYMEKNYNPME